MGIKSYEDLRQVNLNVSLGGQRLDVSVYFIDMFFGEKGKHLLRM